MESLSAILGKVGIVPGLTSRLREGQELYLVGGAIRDWIAGRPAVDFDFTLPDDPTALAREFAAASGGAWFFLDESRRQSRVVARQQGKALTYDFAPFRGGSLEEDLALRDFTINAMAYPLHLSPSPSPSLIDPLNGFSDFQSRTLRCCSSRVLVDDPLRILKGIRHAASLDLSIEAQTALLMKSAVPLLPTAAPERIRQELASFIHLDAAARHLQLFSGFGVDVQLFGPRDEMRGETDAGQGVDRVVTAAAAMVDRPDNDWLTGIFAEEVEAGLDRLSLVKLAVYLWHYNPAVLSSLQRRLRFSRRAGRFFRQASELRSLPPLSSFDALPEGRPQAIWACAWGPDPFASLLLMAGIDRSGEWTSRIEKALAAVRIHAPNGKVPGLVDGAWLQAHFGWPEGPKIGAALEFLRQAELDGRIRNTAEAKRLVEQCRAKND